MGFSTSGIANGSETISVVPAASNSIYDTADNAAATSQSNNTATFNEKVLPTLTTVGIASDNANTDGPWATTGDTITLTFVSDEIIADPADDATNLVVTFKSGGVAVNASRVSYTNATGDKINWTAQYDAASGDTEGNVTFSVAFKDVSGNVGSPEPNVTDSSTVRFDKTAPILNTVRLHTNNSPSTHAKTGRVVTLTIVANDSISQPVVTFSSGAAALNNASSRTITYGGSGTTHTASYITDANDTEGDVTVSIDFKNHANIDGTTVSALTSGQVPVVFDKTLPTLGSVSISSNNSTNTVATSGNTVTLEFTADEEIHDSTSGVDYAVTFQSGGVDINDATITYKNPGGGNTYTATYTVAAGDTGGPITFSIAFKDLANNDGAADTDVDGSSAVTLDKTLPSLTTVSIASDRSPGTFAKDGDVVTLTMVANEVISEPVVTFKSGGVAITDTSIDYVNTTGNTWTAKYTADEDDTDGEVTFSAAITDLAGNLDTFTTVTSGGGSVTFDDTPPTVSDVSIESNNSPGPKTYAKDGHVVTLSFTTSEAIADAGGGVQE